MVYVVLLSTPCAKNTQYVPLNTQIDGYLLLHTTESVDVVIAALLYHIGYASKSFNFNVLLATVDSTVGCTIIICPSFNCVIEGIDTSFCTVAADVVDTP